MYQRELLDRILHGHFGRQALVRPSIMFMRDRDGYKIQEWVRERLESEEANYAGDQAAIEGLLRGKSLPESSEDLAEFDWS